VSAARFKVFHLSFCRLVAAFCAMRLYLINTALGSFGVTGFIDSYDCLRLSNNLRGRGGQ